MKIFFGRSAWYKIKHSTDLKIWKRYSIRILEAVRVTAEATVEIADSDLHKELDSLVELGQAEPKTAKTTEALFAKLAAALGSISFYQFGRLPSNLHLDHVTLRHKSNWKLDQFRSVQYVQNRKQAIEKEAFDESKHK